MNKNAVLVFMLGLSAASAFTLEFSLRPGGFVFFPAGPGNKAADGNERFDIGGEAGFRFTPMFTLAASGGWRQFQSGKGGVFNTGFYAGLTLHITFETGRNSNAGGAGAALVQDDGVYPAFLSLYQTSPAGTITMRNNENAEIRDVRVSFRAAGYTASEFPCGTLPFIAKGRSAALPLYADFAIQMPIYHRNALSWDDNRRAAMDAGGDYRAR